MIVNQETAKVAADVGAVAVAVGAVAEVLPPLAALLSIVWLGMQMYDWIMKKWRGRKK